VIYYELALVWQLIGFLVLKRIANITV